MLDKVEDIVVKGVFAHQEKFHIWSQCFHNYSAAIASAGGKGLNSTHNAVYGHFKSRHRLTNFQTTTTLDIRLPLVLLV